MTLRRRLNQIESDTEHLMATRLGDLVDTDSEIRTLLARWDAAAWEIKGPPPSDYRPELADFVNLRRRHPNDDVAILIEFLWRREQARQDDPVLDGEIARVEERVMRELRCEP